MPSARRFSRFDRSINVLDFEIEYVVHRVMLIECLAFLWSIKRLILMLYLEKRCRQLYDKRTKGLC